MRAYLKYSLVGDGEGAGGGFGDVVDVLLHTPHIAQDLTNAWSRMNKCVCKYVCMYAKARM